MAIDLDTYISSGILESYVSGLLDDEEMTSVQRMAAAHPKVQETIESISLAIEHYLFSQPLVQPSPTVKPFLMAIIDYTERLLGGEVYPEPPVLSEYSTPADFTQWTSRQDMQLPPDFEHFYAKIIGYTPKATTAIAWIKEMAPGEVHEDEHEKFLILEGTCDFTIGDTTRQLSPGDVLFIPLHVNHHFRVTSLIPCKVILQRVAA